MFGAIPRCGSNMTVRPKLGGSRSYARRVFHTPQRVSGTQAIKEVHEMLPGGQIWSSVV
jgi:hypothetical protein